MKTPAAAAIVVSQASRFLALMGSQQLLLHSFVVDVQERLSLHFWLPRQRLQNTQGEKDAFDPKVVRLQTLTTGTTFAAGRTGGEEENKVCLTQVSLVEEFLPPPSSSPSQRPKSRKV